MYYRESKHYLYYLKHGCIRTSDETPIKIDDKMCEIFETQVHIYGEYRVGCSNFWRFKPSTTISIIIGDEYKLAMGFA